MAAISELVHTEGDSNTTAARGRWDAGQDDPRIRGLLDRDAAAFMHQSLSSPCLSTIAKAEGIWIE
ncbi:aspartate aminotransferase family protein, partial [Mesorhizobium sp. M2D.F.Ca.ET.145.01.1.1]